MISCHLEASLYIVYVTLFYNALEFSSLSPTKSNYLIWFVVSPLAGVGQSTFYCIQQKKYIYTFQMLHLVWGCYHLFGIDRLHCASTIASKVTQFWNKSVEPSSSNHLSLLMLQFTVATKHTKTATNHSSSSHHHYTNCHGTNVYRHPAAGTVCPLPLPYRALLCLRNHPACYQRPACNVSWYLLARGGV